MEQLCKVRLLVRPLKDYEKSYLEFVSAAKTLSCGDDSLALFEKIAVSATFADDLKVADGQWIIAESDHVEFCLSCESPVMLVEAAGALSRTWRCLVHAVWADKTCAISYCIPWRFRHYAEDGVSLTCASMGRAVFYGDAYGQYRAPARADKERQNAYHALVWGEAAGCDAMDAFFAAAADEETYPARECIDEYGNKIELGIDTDVRGHIAFGPVDMQLLPVRKLLVESKKAADFFHGFMFKYARPFEPMLRENEVNGDMEFLRSYQLADGDYKTDVGGYLLDKAGNRIKSLADFDHAADADGELYYLVKESDFDGDAFTIEAATFWQKKLGLTDTEQSDGVLLYNQDKTEVIRMIDKAAVCASVPEGVTKIRANAFKGCALLKEIALPATLVEIGAGAFAGCSALKAIVIPDGVKALEKGSVMRTAGIFEDCSALESVSLGNGLEKIDIFIFKNCKSLKSIEIPRAVTSLSHAAFSGCTQLSDIVVQEGNASYRSVDGLVYSADGKELHLCPPGKTGTVTVLKSVVSFVDGPFAYRPGIEAIILPPNLQKLNCDPDFGDFSLNPDSLKVVFTNTAGWYGTDDLDVYKKRAGGEPILPEKLSDAWKEYSYLYHVGIEV